MVPAFFFGEAALWSAVFSFGRACARRSDRLDERLRSRLGRPIIAANGAAAAGDAATVLGSASSFVGNTETGKGGSDESAFSSRDKRRFFERDSGAPFCLAKEHACGLDTKIENVQ